MLHFNRFRFDGATKKILHEISGSTTLRIGSHVYTLTGVLVHESLSATSGHYYCDVVCAPHEQTGLAYRCNDTVCSRLIKDALDPDFKVAYMHIYELETGKEDIPVANTLQSDIGNRKVTTMAATAAENQPRRSGLQANVDQQGLLAASEEQRGIELPDEERKKLKEWVEEEERISFIDTAKRSKEQKRGLKWLQRRIKQVKDTYPDAEEPGLSATNVEQQGVRGLQANVEERGLLATSDEQQRRGGLQVNVEERGLLATSDDRQRRGGLQANTVEQGRPAANTKQQRGRRLPTSEEPQNGKLICRGSNPSQMESCTEQDKGQRRLEEQWEKRIIQSMEPTEQSKVDDGRTAYVTKNMKEVKEKYPNIGTKMPCKAKTGAEINGTYLEGQREEEKERMEHEREEQSEEKREQEKMEAMQCKANVARKPRDRLNAQTTLAGSFRVNTNNPSAIDKVS